MMNVFDDKMSLDLIPGSDVTIADFDLSLSDDVAQPCFSNSSGTSFFGHSVLKSSSLVPDLIVLRTIF